MVDFHGSKVISVCGGICARLVAKRWKIGSIYLTECALRMGLAVEEIVFGQGLSSRNPHVGPQVQHQLPIILAATWLSRQVEVKQNQPRETL